MLQKLRPKSVKVNAGHLDKWLFGWTDGWMNGWTDERIDGLAIQQRPKCNNILFSFSVIFGRVRVETPSLKFSGFCLEPKKKKRRLLL